VKLVVDKPMLTNLSAEQFFSENMNSFKMHLIRNTKMQTILPYVMKSPINVRLLESHGNKLMSIFIKSNLNG
jgi:hypothetical protein